MSSGEIWYEASQDNFQLRHLGRVLALHHFILWISLFCAFAPCRWLWDGKLSRVYHLIPTNSLKTKHYSRIAFPPLHTTSSIHFTLRASVWSTICRRLIAVVPFHLEYSRQGWFKENECLVDQKEFFPRRDVTVFSVTYCKSQHVDVLTARSFYLIILFPSCFSVSHSLCWECAGILSKQEASVFPVWGHSLKKKK